MSQWRKPPSIFRREAIPTLFLVSTVYPCSALASATADLLIFTFLKPTHLSTPSSLLANILALSRDIKLYARAKLSSYNLLDASITALSVQLRHLAQGPWDRKSRLSSLAELVVNLPDRCDISTACDEAIIDALDKQRTLDSCESFRSLEANSELYITPT